MNNDSLLFLFETNDCKDGGTNNSLSLTGATGSNKQKQPLPEIPINYNLEGNPDHNHLHTYVNEQLIRLLMADEIKNLIKPIVLSGEQYENRHRVFVQISNIVAANSNFWGDETKKRLFPCY